ncbi:MAG: glycosyltransferase family 4 protein, partial [Acidobacteria bacterium]|nr:glycosyltransferase family 4 protein [Acidobacteriota bacterium]
SLADELAWLDDEGPASPALVRQVRAAQQRYDFFVFFSYRYYHAYHGVRAATDRAVLVPTAERDAAIGLAMFRPVFQRVRAIMYNSFEERDMIHAVAGNQAVPGVVVGVGSEVPLRADGARFRQKFDVRGRFAIYVGRIDTNKGCQELFDFFGRYAGESREGLSLVLVGASVLPVPDHPRIRHLGFLSDEDKFDALAAADALIMPSFFESLSMVALEAWALGRPVVANARCDVLRGQCLRSNGGLFYENAREFAEVLRAIETSDSLARALGENGRAYFERHYTWPVIERRYLAMLEQLRREPAGEAAARSTAWPLPGWIERRRRTISPAAHVLKQIPAGPSRARDI